MLPLHPLPKTQYELDAERWDHSPSYKWHDGWRLTAVIAAMWVVFSGFLTLFAG